VAKSSVSDALGNLCKGSSLKNFCVDLSHVPKGLLKGRVVHTASVSVSIFFTAPNLLEKSLTNWFLQVIAHKLYIPLLPPNPLPVCTIEEADSYAMHAPRSGVGLYCFACICVRMRAYCVLRCAKIKRPLCLAWLCGRGVVVMQHAKAIYAYTAQADNQVSFAKGDILQKNAYLRTAHRPAHATQHAHHAHTQLNIHTATTRKPRTYHATLKTL
jgi:hypothetical protein